MATQNGEETIKRWYGVATITEIAAVSSVTKDAVNLIKTLFENYSLDYASLRGKVKPEINISEDYINFAEKSIFGVTKVTFKKIKNANVKIKIPFKGKIIKMVDSLKNEYSEEELLMNNAVKPFQVISPGFLDCNLKQFLQQNNLLRKNYSLTFFWKYFDPDVKKFVKIVPGRMHNEEDRIYQDMRFKSVLTKSKIKNCLLEKEISAILIIDILREFTKKMELIKTYDRLKKHHRTDIKDAAKKMQNLLSGKYFFIEEKINNEWVEIDDIPFFFKFFGNKPQLVIQYQFDLNVSEFRHFRFGMKFT